MQVPADEVRALIARNGLPPGLLPPFTQASLEGTTFEVHLPAPVERDVEGTPVWYERVLRGTLSPGRVDGLRGVKAKKVLWVPVTAIRAEGEDLVFSVGPLTDRVPRAAFER